MAFDYESESYLEHLNQKDADWFREVLEQIEKYKPRRVLELGCGNGQLSRLLGEAGYQTLSLDHSRTFLQYAEKFNKTSNNRFKQWDLNNRPLTELAETEKKFDLIVIVDVIEHLTARTEVLKQLPSLLTADGILVLQCPNLYCNVVSKNYRHTFKNIAKKIARGFTGWFRFLFRRQPLEITDIKEGLDYLFADHDAVVLTSPFYFKSILTGPVWRWKRFNSFASNDPVAVKRLFWNFWRFVPFVRFLGGRMVITAQLKRT